MDTFNTHTTHNSLTSAIVDSIARCPLKLWQEAKRSYKSFVETQKPTTRSYNECYVRPSATFLYLYNALPPFINRVSIT